MDFFSQSWVKFLAWALFVSFILLFQQRINKLLFGRKRNAFDKKDKVKKTIRDNIARQESWATPLFNNAGTVIGAFFIVASLAVLVIGITATKKDFLTTSLVFIIGAGFGLIFFLLVKSIWLTDNYIAFQPLLFRFFGSNLFKKTIYYNEIQDIKKSFNHKSFIPFVILEIYNKHAKKFKISTGFYDLEVGHAVYEFLKEGLQQTK